MAAFERRRRVRATRADALSPVPFVGLALLLCDLFLFGATALYAPWWVPVLLVLAWFGLLAVSLRWWTDHPARMVVAGVVAALAWFVLVVVGASVLGWG